MDLPGYLAGFEKRLYRRFAGSLAGNTG